MEKKIFELLNKIGCPCNIKGRAYIEKAINIISENGIVSITKELYPKIAEEYNKTPASVERAIRHAVEVCFHKGDRKTIEKVFGNTTSLDKGKLKNSSFLYGLVKYLKAYGD